MSLEEGVLGVPDDGLQNDLAAVRIGVQNVTDVEDDSFFFSSAKTHPDVPEQVGLSQHTGDGFQDGDHPHVDRVVSGAIQRSLFEHVGLGELFFHLVDGTAEKLEEKTGIFPGDFEVELLGLLWGGDLVQVTTGSFKLILVLEVFLDQREDWLQFLKVGLGILEPGVDVEARSGISMGEALSKMTGFLVTVAGMAFGLSKAVDVLVREFRHVES